MHKETANYEAARNAATRIIALYHITAPPVCLEDIADSEGLDIAIAEFQDNEISGFIDFEKN